MEKSTDLEAVRAGTKKFTWGNVICIYDVSRYTVVEFMRPRQEGEGDDDETTLRRILYHPYVDGQDTNSSWDSLEAALVHAIARGSLEINEARWMALACGKLLGLKETK